MGNSKKPPIQKRRRKKELLKEMEEAKTSALPIIKQVLAERIEKKYGGKK